MITFNGKSYMFVYSKLSAGDLMVTALIPSDRLLEQSSGIKQLTTVLVIVCMIIALALGLFLSSQMTGTIKYILRQLRKVSMETLRFIFPQSTKMSLVYCVMVSMIP